MKLCLEYLNLLTSLLSDMTEMLACLYVSEFSNLLFRLRAWGQPFLAYHPGLLRETLAYHGCAELFQVNCAFSPSFDFQE